MLYTGKYVQTHTFKHLHTHTLAWLDCLSELQVFMHADIYTHIPTCIHIDKQTNTFGWMDGWMDGWIDKVPQAKPFNQQLYFFSLAFLYLLRQKVL